MINSLQIPRGKKILRLPDVKTNEKQYEYHLTKLACSQTLDTQHHTRFYKPTLHSLGYSEPVTPDMKVCSRHGRTKLRKGAIHDRYGRIRGCSSMVRLPVSRRLQLLREQLRFAPSFLPIPFPNQD